MMLIPPGVNVHLVPGVTDLRRNIDALGVLIQEALRRDPFSGHMFAFRGQRADLIKILWWDISLKNFGNWRAQPKRIALMGAHARRGHYPRLRSTLADLSPRVNPRAKSGVNPRATTPPPAAVSPPGRRR